MIDGRIEVENFIHSEEFFGNSFSEMSQNTSLLALEDVNPKSIPSTSDYLVAFSTRSQSYCVGYIDIVNSTKISASLSADKLSLYYEIFLNSMSKIIGKLGGKVIKNIGDCLLYYFPNSVNSSEDGLTNCLDCGLAMLSARKIISEEMVSKGLPKINYRVSADYGAVIKMNTSNS
ncbi:MAG: adenylate/guanylate cyclase domain-containing protein, partial [Nitrososphaeraceae archaeon]|nr:adenylate/guanylate cyclase domain-containing protein [Nitrososphaeraceae archaeon]